MKLQAILLATTAFAAECAGASSGYAQASARAVTFGSNTYLSNSGAGILPPPGNFSSRVSWSCWYNTGNIPQNQERTLFASYVHGPGAETVAQVSLDNTYNLPNGNGGWVPNGTHIKMSATDGNYGGQAMTALTDTTVPTDSKWHHITGGWNTSVFDPARGAAGQYLVAAVADNVWAEWDPLYTGGSAHPQPFVTPYTDTSGINNNWTHGAFQDPNTFTVSEYIKSDLAECVFNNNTAGAAAAYSIKDENGAMQPLPLGPLCVNPTGTVPPLCFRGNASAYPTNVFGSADAFAVNGTPLLTAADDPWP